LSGFLQQSFHFLTILHFNLWILELYIICHYLCSLIAWIQQVSHSLLVHFQTTNRHSHFLPFLLRILTHWLKYHVHCPWNQTFLSQTWTSFHCKCFSCSCLTISKYWNFLSHHHLCNQISNFLKHIVLSGLRWKYMVKSETSWLWWVNLWCKVWYNAWLYLNCHIVFRYFQCVFQLWQLQIVLLCLYHDLLYPLLWTQCHFVWDWVLRESLLHYWNRV
jgi:hypothetical protein